MIRAIAILAFLVTSGASARAGNDAEPVAGQTLSLAKMICDGRGGTPHWQRGFEDCSVIESRWQQYLAQRGAWRVREDQRYIAQEMEAVHSAAK